MARKHERDPEKAARIQNLAALGMNQDQIARLERLDPKTLRKWYADEYDQGFLQANANIAKSGYDQAVGRPAAYDGDGRLLREELKPDKSMTIFLLKARLGMKETSAVELSGPAGGPVEFRDLDLEGLTAEELRTFAALLKKAKARRSGVAT